MKALFLNCTLKKTPAESNTRVLINKAVELFREKDIESEVLRPVDFNISFGTSSDEGNNDQWPEILKKIKEADIIIIGSPIWFGVRSSVTQLILERLDGTYVEGDAETGQYPLYGKVAGVIVTGNEDGAHSVAANTLFNLSHLGCVVAPNSDSYWVGNAGPGPSYIEAGGEKHLYTNRTIRYLVDNVSYFAKLLQDNPIPVNLKELDKKAKEESS